jgi:hypothetical protein
LAEFSFRKIGSGEWTVAISQLDASERIEAAERLRCVFDFLWLEFLWLEMRMARRERIDTSHWESNQFMRDTGILRASRRI